MKTFRQFTSNDNLFYCKRNEIQYKVGGVKEITKSHLICDFYDAEGRYNLKIEKDLLDCGRLVNRYNNPSYNQYDVIVFSLESDAIRYCKANLLKELRLKIENAKKAIKSVVDFRFENFDQLNKDWIELEILKLEKKEREIL